MDPSAIVLRLAFRSIVALAIVLRKMPMHFYLERQTVQVVPLILGVLCFSIKHVLADFCWQPAWMALGKEKANGWARPLLLHCAIHGGCTTVILLALRPELWFLGFIDFFVHCLIDRGKSIALHLGHVTQNDRPFWTLLGIDQTLHHLTGLGLALAITMV